MSINTIMLGISTLQKIGEVENDRKFKEEVIKTLQSFLDQINSINHSQMEQISFAFTRMEGVLYGSIIVLGLSTITLSYMYFTLSQRVKALESKINKI